MGRMIRFASTVHIWEIHTDLGQHAALGKQENTTLGMPYGEAKGDQRVLRSWNRTDPLTSTLFFELKDEY